MPVESIVVVGASLAGAKAAEALRKEGFDGRILLLGAEPERPYERPPLSKDYLRGEAPRDQVYVHGEGFYAENEIELRTSTAVAGLDAARSRVRLESGEELPFDRLLLATGAEPRRLRIPGSELEGVYYLRDLADSDAIRARVERGGKLVVVGAGWIGAEVAASARERGLEVTMLYPEGVPLERVLGSETGAVYRELHAGHGVELLPETGVEAFEGAGRVERVRTADGRVIDCEFVVVGIGVAPRTDLAEAAGLDVENGILVDERLEASRPGVFAAGDVANAKHPFYGRPVRIEHWANALRQGPAAARSMLGRGEPYARLPYFYSDQYETSMEYWGYATDWDAVVFRGDPEQREFIAFWGKDQRVLAGMSMNVPEVGEQIEALIHERKEIDAERLADVDTPLDEVTTEPVGRREKPRARPLTAAKNFVAEGVNYTRRLVGDRISRGERAALAEVAAGEGKLVSVDGKRLAVYRDEEGALHALSPVCTHMRCLVEWNAEEKTWDCPCHGSRFDIEGKVLKGPARKDLPQRQVADNGG